LIGARSMRRLASRGARRARPSILPCEQT
jgi:hypothetical protein